MPLRDINDLEKLKKINAALVSRVERSMDQQGNAFSLFQTAISLENRVRTRTEELHSTLRRLEQSNIDLSRRQGKRRTGEPVQDPVPRRRQPRRAAAAERRAPLRLGAGRSADQRRGQEAGPPGRALAGDDGGSAAHAARHFQARRRRGAARHRRRQPGDAVLVAAFGFPAGRRDEGPVAEVPAGQRRRALRPHAAAPHPAEHPLQRAALHPLRRRAGRHQASRRHHPHRCRRHRLRHSRRPARGGVRGIPSRHRRRPMPSLPAAGSGSALPSCAAWPPRSAIP